MDNFKYLKELCYKSLEKKNLNKKEYIDRLEYELFVIKTLGFVDYFLILADIMHWAVKSNILKGISRGSAGGSLLSYLLGITNIDPIEWDLPFERFLNPGRAGIIKYDFKLPDVDIIEDFNFIDWYNENKVHNEQFNTLEEELGRLHLSEKQKFQIKYMFDNNIKVKSKYSGVLYNLGLSEIEPTESLIIEGGSAPDIDSDVPRAERHRIIEYLINKYGQDYVAAVAAYNYTKARQCIRDAGRALNKPYIEYDQLSKKIPLNKSLKDMIKEDSTFKKLYEQQDDMLMLALGLENTINAISTHAAGVIISKEPLLEHLPLLVVHDKKHKHSYNLTAWDKDQSEEIGLLKLDLLGLKTLDILSTTYKFIKQKEGITDYNVNDLYNVSLNDKETYQLINEGKTTGIFQISSTGMTKLATDLQVESIHDLALLVALYRPGPLESGMVDDLIATRKNQKPRIHIDKAIDHIFDNTYGIMVYQEQLMEMLRVLAGYSLAEADKARKGFAKKNEELFNQVLNDALERMDKRGYGHLKEKIADMLKGVARYLFNKSHSYAYGILGYYTAYYKAHYPLEFISAVLELSDTPEELQELITRFTLEGYNILPPDIRYSKHEATPDYENNGIRLGYKLIKGVSKKASRALTRISKKKIENIEQFLEYVLKEDITTKDLKSICYVGLLDSFIPSRKSFIENIDNVIKELKKKIEAKQKIEDWKIKLENQYQEKTKPWELELEINASKYTGKDLEKEQKKYENKVRKFKEKYPTLDDYINNNNNLKKWYEKLNYKVKFPDIEEYDKSQLYQFEKEYIGMYISGSPIDELYQKYFKYFDLKTINDLINIEDKTKVHVIGFIESISKKKTKKGNEFWIIDLFTIGGNIDMTVWSNTLQRYEDKLKEGHVFIFECKVDTFNDRKKLILDTIIDTSKIKESDMYSMALVPLSYAPILENEFSGLDIYYIYKIDDYIIYLDSYIKVSYEKLKDLPNVKFI